jgi:ATP-dependent DNA helicase RecQ
MVRYAFGRGCRTRFIYDYFAGGTRGGAEPHCGTCDVCLGWRRVAGRELDDAEYEQVRIALSGVGRLSGRFGVERVAQMLTGSTVDAVTSRGLDRVPTFGKLGVLGLERVKELLSMLADAGLVERQGIEGGRPGAFVLALTPEGRRVAMGETRPALPMPGAAPSPRRRRRTGSEAPAGASGPPVENPELLERLRQWRSDEARRRNVPAYVVFHDRTLAALAAARPRSAAQLLDVKGVGSAKLEAYGDALLALLG